MMQLINFFQSKGGALTFACTAKQTDYQVDLEPLGIHVAFIKLNSDSFDVFVKELNPTMVVFDRFTSEEQFGWRVLQQCPEAFRVLNTEDLHFLRDARRQAVEDGRTLDISQQSDLRTGNAIREISALYRSDLTILVSELEIDLLKSTFQVPSHLLYYLPLFASDSPASIPSFEDRDGFLFIGNFLHKPNLDAVSYLKETIWPLIRALLPAATLNIYGAYPGQKALSFHNADEGFYVHGRADDALKVNLEARVSLVPLRFGAGIKGKLQEAMVCGTPSVTTSIGAESMQYETLWNGEITDSPDSFARAAVDLYTNQEKWMRAQEDGFTIIENRYKPELHLPNFEKMLEEVFNNLEEHRSKDFTSHLMQQEFMMSSR
ncbi:MAG: glycosyltransferase involved in cell wall biosynthesis, partial [Crocinitomicaceae bacterium]